MLKTKIKMLLGTSNTVDVKVATMRKPLLRLSLHYLFKSNTFDFRTTFGYAVTSLLLFSQQPIRLS